MISGFLTTAMSTTPVTDGNAISCNRFNLKSIPVDQFADDYVAASVSRYWEDLAGRAIALLDRGITVAEGDSRREWEHEAAKLHHEWYLTQQPGAQLPTFPLTPEEEIANILQREIERVGEYFKWDAPGSDQHHKSLVTATLTSARDALSRKDLVRMSTAIVSLRQYATPKPH